MSKSPGNKSAAADLSRFCKSTFTLTFAVEVLGIDEWQDCEQGWLDLGPYVQGMKIQYQLYPGQTYDLDILIWPHAAKIWCGGQYGWVRTWQFLERRWLTFSIRHAFPVRVIDFQNHLVTVMSSVGTGSLGTNAKNDKNFAVFLPPLGFGERRYFASFHEAEESLLKFVQDLIWSAVVEYIPSSFLDGVFDVPAAVTDVRHQDASLYYVREAILKRMVPVEVEEEEEEVEEVSPMRRKDSKIVKEKEKKKPKEMVKFEIKLLGDSILSGTGRIVPFETVGDRPPDLGEIIVLISSNNLPAQDDYPVVFVNVDNLHDVPLYEFKALRITQLYTRWKMGNEEHSSQMQPIKSKKDIAFNDHHAIPLPYELVSKVMAGFFDDYYEIQLRGIRQPPQNSSPVLFGYQKGDRDFDLSLAKTINVDLDFLIAVTKIHAKKLAKALNSFIRGEYPLYPPTTATKALNRESVCTNDINGIMLPVEPDLVVSADVVLLAQMTLEVSIGLVGCKSRQQCPHYSRMFSLIKDSNALMSVLRYITTINEDILETEKRDDVLTGFVVDTGDVAFLFVEGPIDGHILRVWDMTEDYYPIMKPLFSCTVRYSGRIYPELLGAATPFSVLKMFVPLGVLLACPSVYARPALPLPTRAAVLKIGRLLAGKLQFAPTRSEMPTGSELKSFRLELCVAPRPPPPVCITDKLLNKTDHSALEQARTSVQSVSRINWDK